MGEMDGSSAGKPVSDFFTGGFEKSKGEKTNAWGWAVW